MSGTGAAVAQQMLKILGLGLMESSQLQGMFTVRFWKCSRNGSKYVC